MQTSIRYVWVSLALFTLAPCEAWGQAPSVLNATARAERTDVQLGQPVRILVEVKGWTAAPEVRVPATKDCFITAAGRAAQPSILAGLNPRASGGQPGQNMVGSIRELTDKLSAQALDPKLLGDPDLAKQYEKALADLAKLKQDDYTFVYHVQPKRTGPLTIPPFSVTAGGQTVTTAPVKVSVTNTKSQGLLRLALSLSNPRPLVGEEVQLYLDVLVRRGQVNLAGKTFPHLPLKGVNLSMPPLESAAAMELVKPLDKVLAEHAPPQGHHGYRINSLPREAVFDKEPDGFKNDTGWYRRRLTVPVRLKEAGKVVIPAAGVAGEAYVPDISGPAKRGGRSTWKGFSTTSSPLEFEVRDLPGGATRPRDFSGNIGELRVKAEASQTRMPAGTPFTLTVTLDGLTYLPRPGSLDLAGRPEFTKRFRVLLDHDRDISDTVREITYTLRPLDEKVTEVPPVTVSYYDTKTDKFKTAASPAIPLQVTPGAKPVAEVADTSASEADPTPLEDLDTARKRGFWTRSLLPQAVLVTAGVIVLAVLAGGLMGRTVRRLKRQRAGFVIAQQQRREVSAARQQLHSTVRSATQVREVLHQLLRGRYGMPPGEITPSDAFEKLRQAGVPEELARECEVLLETCAAAEFAPGLATVSPAELSAAADRLVAHLTGREPPPPAPSVDVSRWEATTETLPSVADYA